MLQRHGMKRYGMRKRANVAVDDTRMLAVAVAAGLVGVAAAGWALMGRRQEFRFDKRRPDMPSLAGGRGLRVERTVTVMRSADELYARWRDFPRLPELMPHLESVTPIDATRSRWVARGPGDMKLEWDAELVADEPGRLIAWRSFGGADVDHAGSVRFTPAPADRGTEVKVLWSYAPPAGRVGDAVATFVGRGGDREVREDLRRFKQEMETDEVATAGRRRDDDDGASVRAGRLDWR
jgi:uncharacterized membrane protein